MERNLSLEIAKILAPVIDPSVPVSPVLGEISDYDTAEAGEMVYKFTSYDTAGDTLRTVGAAGSINVVKITPKTPTLVSFTGIQTDLDYVLEDEVLNSPDLSALARRKDAHARAMDKKELKEALDLILAVSAQEVVQGSADDIYLIIEAMIAKCEAYGDNGILLVGTDVFRAIRKYDRANADSFNYKVSVKELLADNGIELQKIAEEATYVLNGGSATKVLAADKAILVMRRSTIANGKPLQFIRRKINPALAEEMGVEVDKAFRATLVSKEPQYVNSTDGIVLGYGTHMYESRICALINEKAVCWATIS
jgi:hypothetical protein